MPEHRRGGIIRNGILPFLLLDDQVRSIHFPVGIFS
jgi:hypothetical protein